jgi:MOSC domain-containing protein YiiM
MELLSRKHPKFTIEFINKIAFNAKDNQEALKELLSCSELAGDYHDSLAKRYKDKDVGLQEWQRDEYVEGRN